ncbi:aspartate kinase [Tissierella sp. MSJ-40]|uniref:Aspartokinase n=1 Tax=Tissierella simiarum TaxID=2841534 RepID=A0ABS6E3F0_9FIRM|nr:aspartate kinase [Tissierella simiarum]MBU5437106.1 aspartate kinase [Tissierella simiarum]
MTLLESNIIVQKYGGSSVSTPKKISQIANKIVKRKKETQYIVVVVSAMGKTTNHLIQLAKEICTTPCDRELDVLLSTGEQQSIALLCMALNQLGCEAISLTGIQAGIKTKGNYTRSSILDIRDDIIKNHLLDGKVVVIAGFQGVNQEGDITTLGRGGSDTTAVALAAKLNCPCEIYTDVDGIYPIDPRIYSDAKKLSKISYDIALEMARLGAKVIDKRALSLGKKFQVPIYVGHSFNEELGTNIGGDMMEELKVTSLVIDDSQIEVKINNIPNRIDTLSKVFEIVGRYNLDISMAENNSFDATANISFTCPREHTYLFPSIKKEIVSTIDQWINIEINDTTRVSVVGTGRVNQAEITAQILNAVKESGLKYKKISTSELSLSYFFEGEQKGDLINKLAKVFDL